MKSILLACFLAVPVAADEPSDETPLPKDLALQEQYVLASAKMKTIAEMQDLILQQQKLMLRHLDALRQEVAQLQRDRTNRVTQAEFQACLAKIAQVQADLEKSRESTEQNVRKIVRELMPPTAASVTIASNIAGGPIVQTYQVQKGDTFLKILARINESFEKRNMPHLTQDQLERANPSLNPNKIKAGQVIYIPAPEGAR